MQKIHYFDIHSHLHSNFFKEDIKKIIEKMEKKKIWTICVGVNFRDSKKSIALAKNHTNIFTTIGIHPTEKETFNEKKFQKLLDNNDKIVGVGECGLDYYWPAIDYNKEKITKDGLEKEKKRQKKLFIQQIDFAIKNSLPLMLHIRPYKNSDAYWDAFKILDRYKNKNLKANFHFFTDTLNIAKEIIKRNFSLSLPGVITFANLDLNIQKTPIKNIMSETDSPFAAPKPYRGKINTPLHIPQIVEKITNIKKNQQTKSLLVKNALDFWNIQNF